jgi:hypothetical protein
MKCFYFWISYTPDQGLKNVTKRNETVLTVFFQKRNETKRKIFEKMRNKKKRNEIQSKKLKRKNNSVSEKKKITKNVENFFLPAVQYSFMGI